MRESILIRHFKTERELTEFAGKTAQRWRAIGCDRLLVGLRGQLGAGKTAWVRAMLRGLGYAGRVPSPTYTLLEQYSVEPLRSVHLDLYRLGGEQELENIGLRDWLAESGTWIIVEWPDRAPRLEKRCDVLIDFEIAAPEGRGVTLIGAPPAGIEAVAAAVDLDSSLPR